MKNNRFMVIHLQYMRDNKWVFNVPIYSGEDGSRVDTYTFTSESAKAGLKTVLKDLSDKETLVVERGLVDIFTTEADYPLFDIADVIETASHRNMLVNWLP